MRWDNGHQYSPQEINLMQKDALERVRQMQQRSEQMIKRTRNTPSFFVEENNPAAPLPAGSMTGSTPAEGVFEGSPSSVPPASRERPPLDSALDSAKERADRLLGALNLDHDRLLILAVLFLLYTDGADKELLLALAYIFL